MASLLLSARVVVDSKAWFDGTEVRGAESESAEIAGPSTVRPRKRKVDGIKIYRKLKAV